MSGTDRVRLVTDALVVGALGALPAMLVLILAGWQPRGAAALVFALGALALGVGVLGWSGSVMAGPGIENMQAHLDVRSNWTEAASRRAMARISGFGGGVMLGSSIADVVLFSA